jgi:hypothetical protein
VRAEWVLSRGAFPSCPVGVAIIFSRNRRAVSAFRPSLMAIESERACAHSGRYVHFKRNFDQFSGECIDQFALWNENASFAFEEYWSVRRISKARSGPQWPRLSAGTAASRGRRTMQVRQAVIHAVRARGYAALHKAVHDRAGTVHRFAPRIRGTECDCARCML